VNKEIVRTVAVLLVIEFGQRKRVGHSGRISYKNVLRVGGKHVLRVYDLVNSKWLSYRQNHSDSANS
jgi:hypothetical protein